MATSSKAMTAPTTTTTTTSTATMGCDVNVSIDKEMERDYMTNERVRRACRRRETPNRWNFCRTLTLALPDASNFLKPYALKKNIKRWPSARWREWAKYEMHLHCMVLQGLCFHPAGNKVYIAVWVGRRGERRC